MYKFSFCVLCSFAMVLSVSCAGDDGDPSETSSAEEWVGTYYQSIYPSSATSTMYTIDLREDFSAVLTTEFCGDDEEQKFFLGWSLLDDRSIQFHGESGELLDWFGAKTGKDVIMRLTKEPDIVEVSFGDYTEGPALAGFRRGTGCLVVIDSNLGCGDGSFVRQC